MYHHILIATDGSELSDRAVSYALELAKALGAKVTAVTVTDMFPTGPYSSIPWPVEIEQYEAAAGKVAKAILDKVGDAARRLGVACDLQHIADQLPADGIIAACQAHDCDLIVMASHGRRGLSKLMLGSETNKVITLSPVSVLVCR